MVHTGDRAEGYPGWTSLTVVNIRHPTAQDAIVLTRGLRITPRNVVACRPFRVHEERVGAPPTLEGHSFGGVLAVRGLCDELQDADLPGRTRAYLGRNTGRVRGTSAPVQT